MSQQWDEWKTYRGAMIWRHLLKETTPYGRKKWMYSANVKNRVYPIYSDIEVILVTSGAVACGRREPCRL